MSLISILLPAYNASSYLKDCLDSILRQSEDDWELLAVDDFSTDETWQLLKSYAAQDQRIKIFKNQEKGIIPALRLAFQQSKGTYITRMDADDGMAMNKLALLKAALVGKGYLATGFVEYFSEQHLGQGYQKYANWLNELCLNSSHFNQIYRECVIPSPCWMLHREDLIRCGAFEPNRYPEDYDLCFRFYEQKLETIGIPKVLHFWRDHPARTSRNSETYADNRFLDLKLDYFLKLDHDSGKNLVLWGAGKKGKKIAQFLNVQKIAFRWLCNQESKWGHQIYATILEDYRTLTQVESPQIIVAVANPDAQQEIRVFLKENGIKEADFFFFC